MEDQEARDAAAKQRIITHMNEDHHDSIVRYLEAYHKIPSWTAYTGTLSAIDLYSMTFACGGKAYRTAFEPPMESYRDARERAVAMDKECLEILGKSDVTVKEYLPPTGLGSLQFAVMVVTFVGYSQRWWFEKGEIVEWLLGSSFAEFSWRVQPWIIGIMLTLHSAEAVYFARDRLGRHSVNIRTLNWWLWFGSVFIEGLFCFRRFDHLVERKREDKGKQKH